MINNIIDLVDYISLEARILNNPLFGSNVNLKDKRKRVKDTHIGRVNVNIVDVNENKQKSKLSCWYCKLPHIIDVTN